MSADLFYALAFVAGLVLGFAGGLGFALWHLKGDGGL